MGAETRWRPTPLRRVLRWALPMVHHSSQRRDTLEAREKAKEYRRKTKKSGCLALTSLLDLWLNQAHWALWVSCKINTDLITVDFQAIGCSGCSQKKSNRYCPTRYNHIVSDFLTCAFRKKQYTLCQQLTFIQCLTQVKAFSHCPACYNYIVWDFLACAFKKEQYTLCQRLTFIQCLTQVEAFNHCPACYNHIVLDFLACAFRKE